MLIRFNKPYGVLSQFTAEGRWRGLKEFIALPGVHAAGRLDADSEGLLLLTDDGPLQARIANPRFKMAKTYLVQVEGEITEDALRQLRQGVQLNDGPPYPPRHVRWMSPHGYGRAYRPFASARAFLPHGWSSPFVKAATAKCAA